MELKLLTVDAAVERLNVSRHTIYKAVREGELQTVDVPNHVLFTPEQLEDYVELRRQQGKRDGELTPADGLRVPELAQLAGVSPKTIRTMKHRGRLRAPKVTGKLLVPWSEARRVLEARGVNADDELDRLKREKAAEAA